MTRQAMGFTLSILIHGLSLAVFVTARLYVPESEPVVIDFSLGIGQGGSTLQARGSDVEKKKIQNTTKGRQRNEPVKARVRQPPVQKDMGAAKERFAPLPDEKAWVRRESSKAIAEEQSQAAPVGAALQAQELKGQTGDTENISEPAASGSGGEGGEAYFDYIRDAIQRNLTYPALARRMGWAGLVRVSFVICRDGQVKDIQLVDTSGFPVLDENVIAVIKRSCPLPKPPVEARIVMPIEYRLN